MSAPGVSAEEVRRLLCVMRQWEDADAEPWAPLIEAAATFISRRALRVPEPGDSRLALAAAGCAAYQIALCETGAGDVSAFHAGDMSVTMAGKDNSTGARRLMEACLAGAGELLRDNDFVFLEV